MQGSLGGLQVLDLSPEGQMHQRILSVGKDPLQQRNVDPVSCIDAQLYSMCRQPVLSTEESQAFSFTVRRPLEGLESGEYLVHLSEWSYCSWTSLLNHIASNKRRCACQFSIGFQWQRWKPCSPHGSTGVMGHWLPNVQNIDICCLLLVGISFFWQKAVFSENWE